MLESANEKILNNSLIPITEIAARYSFLSDVQKQHLTQTVFGKLPRIIEVPSCHERLANVLCYFRWISQGEANAILDQVDGNSEFGKVEVIFALGEMNTAFSYEEFITGVKTKLSAQNGSSDYAKALADSIFRRLEDQGFLATALGQEYRERLEDLVSYILTLPYRPGIHNSASYWIDKYAIINPKLAASWMLSLIEKLKKNARYHASLYVGILANMLSAKDWEIIEAKIADIDQKVIFISRAKD